MASKEPSKSHHVNVMQGECRIIIKNETREMHALTVEVQEHLFDWTLRDYGVPRD